MSDFDMAYALLGDAENVDEDGKRTMSYEGAASNAEIAKAYALLDIARSLSMIARKYS